LIGEARLREISSITRCRADRPPVDPQLDVASHSGHHDPTVHPATRQFDNALFERARPAEQWSSKSRLWPAS
jgi:hypothetical protein